MEFLNIWTKERVLVQWVLQESVLEMRSGMLHTLTLFPYMELSWISDLIGWGMVQSDTVN